MVFNRFFGGGKGSNEETKNKDRTNRQRGRNRTGNAGSTGTQVDYSGKTIRIEGTDGASIGNIVNGEVVPDTYGEPTNGKNQRNKNKASGIQRKSINSGESISQNRGDITISGNVDTGADVSLKRGQITVGGENFGTLSVHKKYGSILLGGTQISASPSSSENVVESTKRKIKNVESGHPDINMSGAEITLSDHVDNVTIGNKRYSSGSISTKPGFIITIGDIEIDHSNGFFTKDGSQHDLSKLSTFGIQMEEGTVFIYQGQKIFISGNRLVVSTT